ncbi:MAG: hypothetical protein HY454_01610 [Parcubacteria group bacterium]|nr:hypothetical protein [Parcubacteria group bacterium]
MTIRTITKATTRGQITIPKAWRDSFQTNNYLLQTSDSKLEITPVDEEELEWLGAEVIFNAGRDNNGKGIEINKFIKILESLKKGDGQNTKAAQKSPRKRQG